MSIYQETSDNQVTTNEFIELPLPPEDIICDNSFYINSELVDKHVKRFSTYVIKQRLSDRKEMLEDFSVSNPEVAHKIYIELHKNNLALNLVTRHEDMASKLKTSELLPQERRNWIYEINVNAELMMRLLRKLQPHLLFNKTDDNGLHAMKCDYCLKRESLVEKSFNIQTSAFWGIEINLLEIRDTIISEVSIRNRVVENL